jgi:2-oxoacid:acceptor oxidoreductase delta subunit (pyruvate/2-ketoisovalerate family)
MKKNYLEVPFYELPMGIIIPEAGNAVEYDTGSWGTFKPMFHEDRCIQCYICWVVCPDSSVIIKDGNVVGFDYFHCKGCGLCAAECPPKANAITMEKK